MYQTQNIWTGAVAPEHRASELEKCDSWFSLRNDRYPPTHHSTCITFRSKRRTYEMLPKLVILKKIGYNVDHRYRLSSDILFSASRGTLTPTSVCDKKPGNSGWINSHAFVFQGDTIKKKKIKLKEWHKTLKRPLKFFFGWPPRAGARPSGRFVPFFFMCRPGKGKHSKLVLVRSQDNTTWRILVAWSLFAQFW